MIGGQQQKVLALLESNKDEWVALPEILALGVAQYNARIYELRVMGYDIQNKTAKVNGVKHSWYCLQGTHDSLNIRISDQDLIKGGLM